MTNPLTKTELEELINKHNSITNFKDPRRKEILNKETMFRLLQQFTVREIMKLFRIAGETISEILPYNERPFQGGKQKHLINNLDKLYECIGKGMNNTEIAKELGVDGRSLGNVLDKYNIPRRAKQRQMSKTCININYEQSINHTRVE